MDRIFSSWLERQYAEIKALSESSDRLALLPHPDTPPREYLVRFDCQTLVQVRGEVRLWADGCVVLFRFPPDYLRAVPNPAWIISLRSPANLHHPNVFAPFICLGHTRPGTSLCELVYQVFDVLTFAKLTPREDDALNRDACAWARRNMERFPVDARPLRRGAASCDVSPLGQGSA